MRILSKGSKLPFVHESVGWDGSTNFKDYDIVFVNLRTLEESAQDYDHPCNESDGSPKLLDSSDVSTFISHNGHMIIYLPDSPIAEMGNTTTKKKGKAVAQSQQLPQNPHRKEKETEPYSEYNLFDWLPFSVTLNTNESGESVEAIASDWEWYFGNRFPWEKIISIKSRSSKHTYAIAKNSYGANIATKVNKPNGGFVALIPPDDRITYSGFVKNTLQNVFDIDSSVEGRAPPAWLSDYSLPKEEAIEDSIQEKQEEIEELESEIESLTKFKKLLYETNTNLEEVTREALRELGFTVDGEVPGKRDGILRTSKTDFALEITGTTGGIKLRKGRQLDDWVENVMADSPGNDVSGLLIVNPKMGTPPDERDISIEPNVQNYMEQRGDYKILTSIDLYRLVELKLKEGVDKNDIEEMFYQENALLSLPDEYEKLKDD